MCSGDATAEQLVRRLYSIYTKPKAGADTLGERVRPVGKMLADILTRSFDYNEYLSAVSDGRRRRKHKTSLDPINANRLHENQLLKAGTKWNEMNVTFPSALDFEFTESVTFRSASEWYWRFRK